MLISLTIAIQVDEANGHEQRMPVELLLGIGSAAQATKVLSYPGAHQHDHGQATQLGEHIEHLEVDQRRVHVGLVIACVE